MVDEGAGMPASRSATTTVTTSHARSLIGITKMDDGTNVSHRAQICFLLKFQTILYFAAGQIEDFAHVVKVITFLFIIRGVIPVTTFVFPTAIQKLNFKSTTRFLIQLDFGYGYRLVRDIILKTKPEIFVCIKRNRGSHEHWHVAHRL